MLKEVQNVKVINNLRLSDFKVNNLRHFEQINSEYCSHGLRCFAMNTPKFVYVNW
jgi:hypothetical protein